MRNTFFPLFTFVAVFFVVSLVPANAAIDITGWPYRKGDQTCICEYGIVKVTSATPAVVQSTCTKVNTQKKAKCLSDGVYVGLDGQPQPIPTQVDSALSGSGTGGSLMGMLGQLAGQFLSQMMNKQQSGATGAATPVATDAGTVNTATTDTVLNSLKTDSVSDINGDTQNIENTANSNYDSLLDKFFDNNPPEVKEAATKGSADQPADDSEGGGELPSSGDVTKARPVGIGSVKADESGAVITVDISGDQKNGIVGFFGSVGSGFKQATTPIGKLCSARPWSGSLVSKVIPDTFFDGLCSRFGYTPGAPLTEADTVPLDTSAQERVVLSADRIKKAKPSAPTRGITCDPGIVDLGGSATVKWSCGRAQLAQVSNFIPTENGDPSVVNPRVTITYGVACDDKVTAQCTVQVVNPRLTIWSEPKSVALGTRATVFWNAQDVTGCSVNGPSFHETGVQGGASTVPITESTTFSMECRSISGATTTKDLIIDLSL